MPFVAGAPTLRASAWSASRHSLPPTTTPGLRACRALSIRQRAYGHGHLECAQAWASLGTSLFDQGKVAAAGQAHREALAIRQRALGPAHPSVGQALNNVGK